MNHLRIPPLVAFFGHRSPAEWAQKGRDLAIKQAWRPAWVFFFKMLFFPVGVQPQPSFDPSFCWSSNIYLSSKGEEKTEPSAAAHPTTPFHEPRFHRTGRPWAPPAGAARRRCAEDVDAHEGIRLGASRHPEEVQKKGDWTGSGWI